MKASTGTTPPNPDLLYDRGRGAAADLHRTQYIRRALRAYVPGPLDNPLLTSRANPLIKKVRRASRRGELTADGLVVAESLHLLREALRSGAAVRAVLVAEGAQAAREAAAALPPDTAYQVSASLFAEVATTENSQGLIALVEPPQWRFEDLASRPGPIVILDGVQDPGNAGAIVRSAEAFDAAGVVFGDGCASPHHPKTLRAAAGSLFRLPYVSFRRAVDILEAVHGCGRRLLAATAHDGTPIDRVSWRRRGPGHRLGGSRRPPRAARARRARLRRGVRRRVAQRRRRRRRDSLRGAPQPPLAPRRVAGSDTSEYVWPPERMTAARTVSGCSPWPSALSSGSSCSTPAASASTPTTSSPPRTSCYGERSSAASGISSGSAS